MRPMPRPGSSPWRWQRLLAAALLLLGLLGLAAQAHETLPASLLLQEREDAVFEVRWRLPHTQGAPLAVQPHFGAQCTALAAPESLPTPGAQLLQWPLRCEGGLRNGATVALQGLEQTQVDVLVQVRYRDGQQHTRIARPRQPVVALGLPATPAGAAIPVTDYLALGVEHILGGVDHLLFVLCLVLLVPTRLALLQTITAFTLAHSLTLALAALGLVRVAQAPVEATIALSIVFLARELAQARQGRAWSTRHPSAVAFAFGLLHGFGFAGALSEVGLPPGDIPLALLLFNLGVEAGQLLFVATVLLALALLRRAAATVPASAASVRWMELACTTPVYAIGAVAAFWWLQRMAEVLNPQLL